MRLQTCRYRGVPASNQSVMKDCKCTCSLSFMCPLIYSTYCCAKPKLVRKRTELSGKKYNFYLAAHKTVYQSQMFSSPKLFCLKIQFLCNSWVDTALWLFKYDGFVLWCILFISQTLGMVLYICIGNICVHKEYNLVDPITIPTF